MKSSTKDNVQGTIHQAGHGQGNGRDHHRQSEIGGRGQSRKDGRQVQEKIGQVKKVLGT